MRILLFHPSALPPRDYGGVERVVLWLAKGLQERGHHVFVAAFAGSVLPQGCQLIEVNQQEYSPEFLLSLLPKSLDIIHFMAPVSKQLFEGLGCPALLTVHGNGKPGELFPKNTVFLSQNHADRHGASAFIYNGIDPAEFIFNPSRKRDSFLFLSKTNWRVKNLSGAMKYCRKAGVALQIAGGNRPLFKRFLCSMLPGIRWRGPVAGREKAELLSNAQALVFPILWPEPFGLVVAEALMSGTPVIAFPRGSMREMLPPSVGLLPEAEEEWIQALQTGVRALSPESCRQWAWDHFHYLKMAEGYERIYQMLLSGAVLNQKPPQAPLIER